MTTVAWAGSYLAFDDQGETLLAKGYGTHRLHRLRWSHESPKQPSPETQQAAPAAPIPSTETGPSSAESKTAPELSRELIRALRASQWDVADEFHKALLELAPDETGKKQTQAYCLRLRYKFAGDTSALQSLRDMTKDPIASGAVHSEIGRCYEFAGDFEKAATAYEAAAASMSKETPRVLAASAVARCLYNSGNKKKAFERLMAELETSSEQDGLTKLYGTLASLYEKDGNGLLRAVALEKVIEITPNETGALFQAAYSFPSGEFDELALAHYMKVADFQRGDSAALNNSGQRFFALNSSPPKRQWSCGSGGVVNGSLDLEG